MDYRIELLDDDERMSMDNTGSIDVLRQRGGSNSDRIFRSICWLCEQNAINDLRLLLANLSINKSADDLKDIISNSTRYSDNGQTPLHIAVSKGSIQIVDMLLQRGALVNSIEMKTLCTPLHTAAIHSFHKCISTLIVFGADVTAQSTTGRCPLHYAAANGDIDTIKELLKGISLTHLRNNGSDVNNFEYSLAIRDLDGHTPLHLAVIDGNVKCIEYLIQMGSDLQCKDNDGRSALDIGNQMGHPESVIILLDSSKKSSNINHPVNITIGDVDTATIRLLPTEEYWVVIRESNMLQDDRGNVIVHKSKQMAAVWASKSRKYQDEQKDSDKGDASPDERSGKIMTILRRTARRLSRSNKSASSSPPSSSNNEKAVDFKLYVARIDVRRYKAFQTQVPFVINNSNEDNDNDDDPMWKQFKESLYSSSPSSSSSSLKEVADDGKKSNNPNQSEEEKLKQDIENLRSEISQLLDKRREKDRVVAVEERNEGNLLDISNDKQSVHENGDVSPSKRLSVKEIKTLFENKAISQRPLK